jgi:DNA-binding IclR family transcriptional regulator
VRKLISAVTIKPFTDKTITQVDALLAEIEMSAARGYTTDLEENEEDICCYGSAIVVPGQGVVGCVSVSMPSYRFKALDPGEAISAIQECTRGIAAEAQTRLTTR